MRFGIYNTMQCPLDKPHAEVYKETLRQIEHADEAGFDVYSLLDHHFIQEFSISANPLAMFCAAAQRARRIRFRTALFNLTPKNPMELAGQIAAADIMTDGRIECGLCRGHAWLYPGLGVAIDESSRRFDEGHEIMLKAWSGERFSHQGQFWNIRNTQLAPVPLQKPHPPIWSGGTSNATYELAGKQGYGLMVPPLLPLQFMEAPIAIYKELCAKHGHTPHISYPRPFYLGDDKDQIRRECGAYMEAYIANNLKPFSYIDYAKEELEAAGYGFYGSNAADFFKDMTYDAMVEHDIAFVGSAQEIVDKIGYLQEKVGITEFALLVYYGGIEQQKSIKQQELFAKDVIPAFS